MSAPLTNEIVDQRIAGRPIVRLGDYVNAKAPMLWRCRVCDHEWLARFLHVGHGRGCPVCSNQRVAYKRRFTPTMIADRLADRPIELRGVYVGHNKPTLWGCLTCGNKWLARFSDIVYKGTNCPTCAVSGFKPSKPAILYYVKIHGMYKIGVTNYTVVERFREDRDLIKIIRQWHYAKGADAYKREQDILSLFAEYRYTGPRVLGSRGDTELFTRDILELENAA